MSGRVSAAVALVTARCAIQFVHIIGWTILHSDKFTVRATMWIRAKANIAVYFAVCHCGMNTIQPAWEVCTAFASVHACGWHSCSCVTLEAIPSFCKTIVTQKILPCISVFSISGVQDFVSSTYINWKENQTSELNRLRIVWQKIIIWEHLQMGQVEVDHCYRNEAVIDANSMDKVK